MAKVLIVDDSSLGRKLIKRILLKVGHEVVAEAENGQEGILEYERVRPEIVTMDVDMPGINGLEASARILKNHPDARIIIISAQEQNNLRIEMGKCGLRYCIIKPVNEENVIAVFEDALGGIGSKAAGGASDGADIHSPPKSGVSGPRVYVSHYSAMNTFIAVKTGEEGKRSTLCIGKETPFNFNEGDPLVIGCESNGAVILSQCEVSGTDIATRSITAETIQSYPLEIENTHQLPVSIYVDIRVISTRRRFPAVIKTFLVNEMVFRTSADMDSKEKVSFDIFSKNKVLPIEGGIVSKTQGGRDLEYVIKLDFDDYNRKKAYLTYLKDLAYSMERSMKIQDAGMEIGAGVELR